MVVTLSTLPVPTGYTMVVIADMLDSSHWQNMDDLKARGVCPPSSEAALSFWRQNLNTAITGYAGSVGATPPVCK